MATVSFQKFMELGGVTSSEQVNSLGVNGLSAVASEPKPEGNYFSRVGGDIKADALRRADRVGAIQKRTDTGIVEKGLQTFGQGAGLAANAIEKTVTELPVVKPVLEGLGAGIKWLSESWPIKQIGDVIGSNKTVQEVITLYDTDPNFKDTVDAVANTARLTADVSAVAKIAELTKHAVKKIQNKFSTKLADAEKGFVEGGTTANDIKMHDNYIKSGDFKVENVYKDPVKKIYQPQIAEDLVNDGMNNFKEHGFIELGDKYKKMFGDFSNVTPKQILENGRLVLKEANTGLGNTLAITKQGIEKGAKATAELGGKIVEKGEKFIENKIPTALSMFTGENSGIVKKALMEPEAADIGIKGGDEALRTAVATGAKSSVQQKTAFVQAYNNAFKNLVAKNPAGKLIQGKKVLYQFADDLKTAGVTIKKGKLDFTTSKIVANPGEIGKINNAYKAIQGWKDWSLKGANELKQLVQGLTKFPSEAGGSSKSPFLGKFSYYLDQEIKNALPQSAKTAYTEMNQKFSNGIGMYEDMVDAFNSGDPFKKLAGVLDKNNDTFRQIIEYYEKTTGNKIQGIVAGRTLAQDKMYSFFLNPRQLIDFFISPKNQAKIVTTVGKKMYGETIDVGITPFRGTPLKTIKATLPYYNSTRAKGFQNGLKGSATSNNLTIQSVTKVAGFWEGGLEPSLLVKIKGKLKDVLKFSSENGSKVNQDSVVLFKAGKGTGTKYEFPNLANPDKALKAMENAGISGGTVANKSLIVYDGDGSLLTQLQALSKKLNVEPTTTKGTVKFLGKEEYGQYFNKGGTGGGGGVGDGISSPKGGVETPVNKANQ
jgi:hypothetical protein